MFIHNSLRRLKSTSVGSFPRFLIMFTLAVAGPLVLFVLGFYNPHLIGPASMTWSFLAIAMLILVCVGGGFLMFKLRTHAGEMSLSQPEVPLKGVVTKVETNH